MGDLLAYPVRTRNNLILAGKFNLGDDQAFVVSMELVDLPKHGRVMLHGPGLVDHALAEIVYHLHRYSRFFNIHFVFISHRTAVSSFYGKPAPFAIAIIFHPNTDRSVRVSAEVSLLDLVRAVICTAPIAANKELSFDFFCHAACLHVSDQMSTVVSFIKYAVNYFYGDTMYNPLANFSLSYQNLPNSLLEDRFSMEFQPVTRSLLPWRDEVLKTAENISRLATKPLMVCLSGGIDGEVVARAFLELGVKFSAVSLRHDDGSNQHDMRFSVRFCDDNKIDHHVINYSPAYFFNDVIDRQIEEGYRSWRPFRHYQLFILETVAGLGGCAVLGGGEQLYHTIGDDICIKFPPDFDLSLQWCHRNNMTHFPFFFMQNPEIYASYMKIPLIEVLLSNPDHYRTVVNNLSLEKIMVYHTYWKNMQRRKKSDGFENVHDLRLQSIKRNQSRFEDMRQELAIPVASIKRQLGI